jgi:ABC-type sulfate transport system permease subunit
MFLFVPLIVVFSEAFKKGAALYLESITEPDAVSAIQLTLIAGGHRCAAELNIRSGCFLGPLPSFTFLARVF